MLSLGMLEGDISNFEERYKKDPKELCFILQEGLFSHGCSLQPNTICGR